MTYEPHLLAMGYTSVAFSSYTETGTPTRFAVTPDYEIPFFNDHPPSVIPPSYGAEPSYFSYAPFGDPLAYTSVAFSHRLETGLVTNWHATYDPEVPTYYFGSTPVSYIPESYSPNTATPFAYFPYLRNMDYANVAFRPKAQTGMMTFWKGIPDPEHPYLQMPVAVVTPPYQEVAEGTQATADGSASYSTANNPSIVIETYEWDWGDGSVDFQGPQATHFYSEIGDYACSLKVIDSAGNWDIAGFNVRVTHANNFRVLYAISREGELAVTFDDGGSWRRYSMREKKSVTCRNIIGKYVAVDPRNRLTAYFSFADGRIFKTDTGLVTVLDPIVNMDQPEPITCLAVGSGELFFGTEYGKVFSVDTSGTTAPRLLHNFNAKVNSIGVSSRGTPKLVVGGNGFLAQIHSAISPSTTSTGTGETVTGLPTTDLGSVVVAQPGTTVGGNLPSYYTPDAYGPQLLSDSDFNDYPVNTPFTNPWSRHSTIEEGSSLIAVYTSGGGALLAAPKFNPGDRALVAIKQEVNAVADVQYIFTATYLIEDAGISGQYLQASVEALDASNDSLGFIISKNLGNAQTRKTNPLGGSFISPIAMPNLISGKTPSGTAKLRVIFSVMNNQTSFTFNQFDVTIKAAGLHRVAELEEPVGSGTTSGGSTETTTTPVTTSTGVAPKNIWLLTPQENQDDIYDDLEFSKLNDNILYFTRNNSDSGEYFNCQANISSVSETTFATVQYQPSTTRALSISSLAQSEGAISSAEFNSFIRYASPFGVFVNAVELPFYFYHGRIPQANQVSADLSIQDKWWWTYDRRIFKTYKSTYPQVVEAYTRSYQVFTAYADIMWISQGNSIDDSDWFDWDIPLLPILDIPIDQIPIDFPNFPPINGIYTPEFPVLPLPGEEIPFCEITYNSYGPVYSPGCYLPTPPQLGTIPTIGIGDFPTLDPFLPIPPYDDIKLDTDLARWCYNSVDFAKLVDPITQTQTQFEIQVFNDPVSVGEHIRIDFEIMLVKEVVNDPFTPIQLITVDRGQLNSVASAHFLLDEVLPIEHLPFSSTDSVINVNDGTVFAGMIGAMVQIDDGNGKLEKMQIRDFGFTNVFVTRGYDGTEALDWGTEGNWYPTYTNDGEILVSRIDSYVSKDTEFYITPGHSLKIKLAPTLVEYSNKTGLLIPINSRQGSIGFFCRIRFPRPLVSILDEDGIQSASNRYSLVSLISGADCTGTTFITADITRGTEQFSDPALNDGVTMFTTAYRDDRAVFSLQNPVRGGEASTGYSFELEKWFWLTFSWDLDGRDSFDFSSFEQLAPRIPNVHFAVRSILNEQIMLEFAPNPDYGQDFPLSTDIAQNLDFEQDLPDSTFLIQGTWRGLRVGIQYPIAAFPTADYIFIGPTINRENINGDLSDPLNPWHDIPDIEMWVDEVFIRPDNTKVFGPPPVNLSLVSGEYQTGPIEF